MIGTNLAITTKNYAVAGGVTYDPDAEAFITAASITDNTQKSAVNQLVLDLKSYNIWTKMKAIYPVLGGNASSHAVNLKTPGTFNLSFATGMSHSSTGMTGNGTSGYGNSNLNPRTSLTPTSNHMSFYSGTQISQNAIEMGLISGNQYTMGIYTSVTTFKNIVWGTYPTNWASVNDTNTLGFQVGSKTSATSLKLYWNNSNVATNTSSYSTSMPNANIYICAINHTSLFYSTKQCRFASIGDGLTDTEASNLYTAVQAYQTSLGRQV